MSIYLEKIVELRQNRFNRAVNAGEPLDLQECLLIELLEDQYRLEELLKESRTTNEN